MRLIFVVLWLSLCSLAVSSEPAYQSKSIHEKNAGNPGYSVEAAYPVFAAQEANRHGLALLQAEIDQFKRYYEQGNPGKWPWHFTATFKVEYQSPQVISVVYTIIAKQDGAHPLHYFVGHAFTPNSGQERTLPSFFRRGTPWLQKLSTYCIASLKKTLHKEFGSNGDSQIERGAAPRPENFKTVLPTAQGMRVYFPTQQIGPNVAGTHIITVPYSEFSGMLTSRK